ncbi:hypothetical protein BGZ67_004024 [Mortierella alpina]|nr:hypothetical protein BGZ67_004024 [Mortierella alpina]
MKDKFVLKGIPIAFMICNSESQYILVKWLRWLKSDCNLRADKFMADCSVTETEAILKAFPGSLIYYCHFHVGQLWEHHLKKSHSARQVNEMRPLLNQVRNADTEEELQNSWQMFTTTFPAAQTLIKYIEKNWMPETQKQRWVKFARQDYQHIDTNNLVESWHKTLKQHHLGNERNVRTDYLMYVLLGVVDQDFRVTYFKIKNGIQPLALSENDKKRKAKAMELTVERALELITERMEEQKFLVKSFTRAELEYTITVSMERSLLLSCTCPDHLKHKIPCKHLYLVKRIFDVFEVKHTPDPDPEDNVVENDQDDFAVDINPPIPESIPINVQLLLRAQRAQEQELRKRKREEEVAEAFADCETKLKELWIKMGNHILRDGGVNYFPVRLVMSRGVVVR